jgi:ATP-dependent exoDNAse (exonuclease V) beta subunit
MEYVCSIIFHKKNLNINTDTLVDRLYDGFSVKLKSTYIDELKNMAKSFLSSELAKDILDDDAIYTEIPFSSSENYHGVIDLILEKGNKIRIIDFKSDLLKTKKAEIKAHYKKQIEYYMRALKQYTDKDIENECLYLFESI